MVRITRLAIPFLIVSLALGSGFVRAAESEQQVEETINWRRVKVIYNVPNRDRAVFITIDDGGAAPPSFGRWLDENKIPITNFVMPEMLHLNRGWYREREFMTFENHTNTHAHMTLSTLREQTEEICRANRLIEGIVKAKPVLYRPPRGSFNANSRRAAAACGIKYIVMWSAMADGGVIRTAGNRPLKAGDIIILHYNGGLPGSMAHLMATIKKNGLQPAFLRDYLQ
jgi:peptidoglycan/xylan/chitin deacetylase (PgdA/CDA1 family)